LKEKDAEIATLESRLAELEKMVTALAENRDGAE